jgi:hypothetical protein
MNFKLKVWFVLDSVNINHEFAGIVNGITGNEVYAHGARASNNQIDRLRLHHENPRVCMFALNLRDKESVNGGKRDRGRRRRGRA